MTPNKDITAELDEQLLADLRRVAEEVDPVPQLTVELAVAAFELLDLDSRLAALVADSLLDDSLTSVRTTVAQARLLSFEADDVRIEVEITTDQDRRHLHGQLLGAQGGSAVVEHATGASVADVDELGQFEVRDVPAGRVRLRWSAPGARPFVTSWVVV